AVRGDELGDGDAEVGDGDAGVGEADLGVLDQVADDGGVVVRCHAWLSLRWLVLVSAPSACEAGLAARAAPSGMLNRLATHRIGTSRMRPRDAGRSSTAWVQILGGDA